MNRLDLGFRVFSPHAGQCVLRMGPVAAATRVSCEVDTALVPLIEAIKDPWFSSETTRRVSDDK